MRAGTLIAAGLMILAAPNLRADDARCGQVFHHSITLNSDLDCSNSTGVAIILEGDNLTFDGNGFQIIGPHLKGAIAGSGRNLTVRNTMMRNYKNGTALFLTDAPGLRVQNNFIDRVRIGISLFASNQDMTGVEITGNVITNSGEFGLILRRYQDASVRDPKIERNDFSGSQSAAIEAVTESLWLSGAQQNLFQNCRNGVVFYGGLLVVSGLDLSQSRIPGTPLTVAEARDVQVFDSNFSHTPAAPAPATFRGTTAGVSASGVARLTIQNTIISGKEIAVILTQHGPQAQSARLENNRLSGNVAGLHFRSEDGSAWGLLKITGNDLRVREPSNALWFLPGVTYAPGSDISGNRFH